jgi:hypothetical protein
MSPLLARFDRFRMSAIRSLLGGKPDIETEPKWSEWHFATFRATHRFQWLMKAERTFREAPQLLGPT